MKLCLIAAFLAAVASSRVAQFGTSTGHPVVAGSNPVAAATYSPPEASKRDGSNLAEVIEWRV